MAARVRRALCIVSPAVLVIALPSTALAEDPDQGGEVAKPEAKEAPPPSPAPRAPDAASPGMAVAPRFAWEPFGYLRLQYKAVQNDPNVEFVGRDDGFELQNARIGVRGMLEHRAAFVLAFDGAVDERAQINVPEGKLRVQLRDAYGDLYLASKFDGPTRPVTATLLRAGFFQTWAEPEALVPDTAREFVDRPIESRGIRATEGFQTEGGLTPGRSLGAAFRIEPFAGVSAAPAAGVEVAVQNGADEFSSNNDNDKPAVSAAGLVRFGKDGYLVAGARYNPRTDGELPFRRDETDLSGSAGFRVPAGPVAIGGGLVFVRTTADTTGGPAQNAFGAHAQLVFLAGGPELPLSFGYRFGILDPSSLLLTDRVMEHTVGGGLGMPRYRMRVQFQLTHVIEQAARDLSNSRVQLAVELAL